MADKFNNKYRIPSARLQNWDYRWAAVYYITICTKNRLELFGVVTNCQMRLSRIGVIADICWYEIRNHAKNVQLDAFVVMPDHIHGILILHEDIAEPTGKDNISPGNDLRNREDTGNYNRGDIVETTHALSLPHAFPPTFPSPYPYDLPNDSPKTIGQKRFQNQGKNSISSIVGSYKSAVSKHAHRLGFEFAWQPRFYDHIIRNHQSYENISHYIINNPNNWTRGGM